MSSARISRKLLLPILILVAPIASFARIFVSVTIAPPALFVYQQPICPGAGYIWVPGYWAYGDGGYYWVPGTWVLAPFVGALWTPGYWGWSNGAYLWNEGYWGTSVGFYGGINYGFGYFGHGYDGGRWNGGSFYYNRAVNNVNITSIHNIYNQTVTNNFAGNRVSYNGGNGGVAVRPTATELAAPRGRRSGPTAEQTHLVQAAGGNRAQLASVNHGHPQTLATPRPSAFTGNGTAHATAAASNQSATAHPSAGPSHIGNSQHAAPANQMASHAGTTAARSTTAARPNTAQTVASPASHTTERPMNNATHAGSTPPRSNPQPRASVPPQHTAQPAARTAAPQHVAQTAPQRAAVPQHETPQQRAPAPSQHTAHQAAPERAAPPQHVTQAAPQRAAPPQHAAQAAPQQRAPAPPQHTAQARPSAPARGSEPRKEPPRN